jgi:hypothetical protein
MRKVFLIALTVTIGINSFAQAKKKSPLDLRIYTITLTPKDEKKAEPIKDEASFMAGKFKTNFLMQAGFTQTDYEYEIDSTSGSEVIKFTVEAKNENQERFSWEGSLGGDNINGIATIRKKGKIMHTYTVSGTWKNKKKVKPQPKTPVVAPVTTDSIKTEQ